MTDKQKVRETIVNYEALRDRAIKVVALPTTSSFDFDEERFIVTFDEYEANFLKITSWSPGYDYGIEENSGSAPIFLFQMSDAEFEAHAAKVKAEEEAREAEEKRRHALRVKSANERKERAEFERLKAKFGGAS